MQDILNITKLKSVLPTGFHGPWPLPLPSGHCWLCLIWALCECSTHSFQPPPPTWSPGPQPCHLGSNWSWNYSESGTPCNFHLDHPYSFICYRKNQHYSSIQVFSYVWIHLLDHRVGPELIRKLRINTTMFCHTYIADFDHEILVRTLRGTYALYCHPETHTLWVWRRGFLLGIVALRLPFPPRLWCRINGCAQHVHQALSDSDYFSLLFHSPVVVRALLSVGVSNSVKEQQLLHLKCLEILSVKKIRMISQTYLTFALVFQSNSLLN